MLSVTKVFVQDLRFNYKICEYKNICHLRKYNIFFLFTFIGQNIEFIINVVLSKINET